MSLCLTILFTSIFCVLALLPICLTINNRISENKKNTSTENETSKEKIPLFSLDERNLQSQPMFWAAIASPLIVGVLLFAIISPNYDLNFTVDAYKTFMEIAQLPSVILALSPILGAFVMYAHRSYQTDIQIKTAKEQLEEAQKKNKVDMYISNKNYILKELNLLKKYNYKIKDRLLLYKKAFTNITTYEETPNNTFHSKCSEIMANLNTALESFISKSHEGIFDNIDINNPDKDYYLSFSLQMNNLLNYLHIAGNDFFAKLPNKKNEYIEKVQSLYDSHYMYMEPESINRDAYQHMLQDLESNIIDSIDFIDNLFLILLNYKTKNNPVLTQIATIRDTIKKLQALNGDKMATENQNNHE